MKKSIIILLAIFTAFQFSGCVTKQKYNELQNQYKKCQDELTFANSENVDFSNAKKQLAAEVDNLTLQTEQLKKDTLSLSRKLRQSERDLAKATRDYDDLLKDFSDLNVNNQNQVNSLLGNIDKYKDELDAKEKLLNAQRDSLNEVKVMLEAKEARIREMQSILDQKDDEVKALKDKVSSALKGFEGSGLNVYEKDGKVYVSMEDKLLFASGSWTINEQGMNAIRNIAQVLESESDISVLIEGHTDNLAYHGNGQVKDNWDLSVMRATAVVKALLQNSNIDPVRLSASGRSQYLPVDKGDTPEARAKNRRTEIILTPNLDQLFQLIQNN
ncbi:MAG: OmpA family protein [Bacteroidales bacterium]|nr:OmpA family protein [Bacteroidales bacterium]